MKARDRVSVAALRSVLGAIDNAGAVDIAEGPRPNTELVAVRGVGAGDVPRRELSEEEVASLVRFEMDERLRAASEYDALGVHEEAERLRTEAAVLGAHLD